MVVNLPTVKLKFILEKIQYISFKYTQISQGGGGGGVRLSSHKTLILYNRSLLKPES